jgi:hypothetical protein
LIRAETHLDIQTKAKVELVSDKSHIFTLDTDLFLRRSFYYLSMTQIVKFPACNAQTRDYQKLKNYITGLTISRAVIALVGRAHAFEQKFTHCAHANEANQAEQSDATTKTIPHS